MNFCGIAHLGHSYDYETFAPPSKNGAGGLAFIGMQRCLDCDSSPISQLATRQQQQGWASECNHPLRLNAADNHYSRLHAERTGC